MKKILDFGYKLYKFMCCLCYGFTLGVLFVVLPYLLVLKLSITKPNDLFLGITHFCLIVVAQLFYLKTYKWLTPN